MKQLFILILLLFTAQISAKKQEYIREYTYEATDYDSRESSRMVALAHVKQELLKVISTLIVSQRQSVDEAWYSEEVLSLAMGVIQTKIIEEKWNGETFYLKAKMKTDQKDIEKRLKRVLKNRAELYALKETEERVTQLLENNAKMRRELARAESDKSYKISVSFFMDQKRLAIAQYWFDKAIESEDKNLQVKYYSKAISYDETYNFAYNNRGIAYLELNENEKAESDFTRSIQLRPKNPVPYNNRGTLYRNLDRREDAAADFTRVIELDPLYFNAYDNRGSLFYYEGQLQKAISDYTRSLEIEPDSGYTMALRGRCYLEQQQFEKAKKDFDGAIDLDPNDFMLYSERSRYFLATNDMKKAVKDLTRALKLNPNSIFDRYRRGKVYFNEGMNAEAVADLERVIEEDPTFAGPYFYCGGSYSNMGGHEAKAIELLNTYLELEKYESSRKMAEAAAEEIRMLKGTVTTNHIFGNL